MDSKLPVLISVDVECTGLSNKAKDADLSTSLRSLDCVVNGRPMGLPFITDSLDQNGLKGTFFIDPFSIGYFGEAELDEVVDRVRKGGHDVQLHLHPSWYYLSKGQTRYDSLYLYNEEEQSELIGLGLEALRKRGVSPTAFRAGSFAADNATYRALKKHGFTLSSSYNISALNDACKIQVEGARNDAFVHDGLTEIPITNYLIRDMRHGLAYAHKPFQVACTSFSTARRVLEAARADRYTCVNLVLHNFEFVDRRHPDWLSRPMNTLGNTANAFTRLCRHLGENQNLYSAISFSELESALKLAGNPSMDMRVLPKINRLHLPMEFFNGADLDGLPPKSEPVKLKSSASKPWYLGGTRDSLMMSFLPVMEPFEVLFPLAACSL